MQHRLALFYGRIVTTGLAVAMWGSGCSFDSSGFITTIENDGAPLPTDAAVMGEDGAGGPDAGVDPCMLWTYMPKYFDPCMTLDPQGPLMLMISGEYVYDTASGVLNNPMGQSITHQSQLLDEDPNIRLISSDSFSIGVDTTLRVIGEYPIMITAWGDITIDGLIDASSKSDFNNAIDAFLEIGAGANLQDCATVGTGDDGVTGAVNIGKGTGGGGGGFGTAGGRGGGHDETGPGGNLGEALKSIPENLRGGCAGGRGGNGTDHMNNPGSGGRGGAGGGVVHLVARDRLTIASSGRLHAGGAGGHPGNPDLGGNNNSHRVGGGGGGSGGWIGLEAADLMIEADAILAANGGAGGAGANNDMGEPGEDGRLSDEVAALGAGDGGGDGGDGGFAGTPAGQPGQDVGDNEGGGGGGGGVGMIVIYSSNSEIIDDDAIFSPAHMTE